jgi:hypothetical protein
VIGQALQVLERRPGRTIAALTIVFALAYLGGTAVLRKPDGRLIVGDAVHYYVYVRSAVFDRDLQFRNEYIRLYGLGGGEPETGWIYENTATGHVRNLMPIGPALLWTPLFLTVAVISAAARAFGAPLPADGYGTMFQLSAALSGIAAAGLGAWFTYRLCDAYFDRRVAIWSTLTVWIASSAIYYSLISPAYSHAASMLAVSVFFCVWGVRIGDTRVSRFAAVGLCAGAAALVRWQDVIVLGAPVLEVIWLSVRARALTLSRAGLTLATCGLAAAVAFIPQNIVWMILYGTPFTVPQGGEFMKWSEPALLRVLLSDWHGLFAWTPIAAIGVIGLVIGPEENRGTAPRQPSIEHADRLRILLLGALAVFVVSWYVNAAVSDWWAGEAFGARRFVSCFPVFTLGVAAIGQRLAGRPALAASLAAVVCASNLLLLFQYQMFMHGRRAPYPAGVYGMTVERFVTPVQLVARWWQQ